MAAVGSLVVRISTDFERWYQVMTMGILRLDLIMMRSKRRGLPLLRVTM